MQNTALVIGSCLTFAGIALGGPSTKAGGLMLLLGIASWGMFFGIFFRGMKGGE